MIIKMCLFEHGYMCPVKLCLNEEVLVIRIYMEKQIFGIKLKIDMFQENRICISVNSKTQNIRYILYPI